MDMMNYLVVALGTIVAGAINAVAGGGTVFSLTALAWTGLPLIRANATNQTALIPGSIGGMIAFRHELLSQWRTLAILFIPTVGGSLLGAVVVVSTAESIFRSIVPFLVLFATLVFAGRERIARAFLRRSTTSVIADPQISPTGYVLGCVLQFAIAFYGGYFSAGIGILMLTALSVMGMSDVVKMNAVKNALAVAINTTSALFFIFGSRVEWQYALLGALCSLIGGYGLGRLALRINQQALRGAIVVAGFVVSAWMFWRLST